MKAMGMLAGLLLCAGAAAQGTAFHEYNARIEELQRDGAQIAQQLGRDALIRQYRDLIDAHPGYPNNIRLETQIAMLYESDFSDQGLPPDLHAASEAYKTIIATYDPDNPYMKTVRKLAADRTAEFDPPLARKQYEDIIADYPAEDALVVQSEYALAKLEEGQGNRAAAASHYRNVLNYAPSGATLSEAEIANIAAYQDNAAASMLTTAIKGADTQQEQLSSLKKFLEAHKEFELAHAEMVHQFTQVVERGAGRSSVDDGANPTVEALLASLITNKKNGDPEEAPDRARKRELRARDVKAGRVKSAQAGPVTDAALAAAPTPVVAGTQGTATHTGTETAAPGKGRLLYTLVSIIALGAIAVIGGRYARRRAG